LNKGGRCLQKRLRQCEGERRFGSGEV
jgi:hypothetical protein